jgi:3-oxoadipate enol-lactonase
VHINGAELYTEVAGAGQPLVFLHAGIAHSDMWDAQFSTFAEHFRVLRYDMRGFGRSSLPAEAYAHVDDLAAILDALNMDRVHIIGASQGGRVALEFALKYPHRVRSMVLAATAVRGYDFSDIVTNYATQSDAAYEAGDIELAVELDLRMWVDGPKRSPDRVAPELRERVREMARTAYPVPMIDATERPLTPPMIDRLWEIKAPSLVLVGEYEVPDFINIAGLVAFGLDTAEKQMIKGAAHMLTMEQAQAFNALALPFLQRHAQD